jgi:hypothetical protein
VLFDSLQRFAQGLRSPCGDSVRGVSRYRARGKPPLCQLLLVTLRSIRRATIVTDAGYTDPSRASRGTFYRTVGPPCTFFTFDAPGTEPALEESTRCRVTPRESRPPLGLSGAPPPICPTASTPPELTPGIGPRHGGRDSRSAPVGSHHFDGLLRSMGSERVASRYRTWGSLGFRRARRHQPKPTRTRSASPPALHPPKVYSSSAAVPHRWGLLPPDRSSRNGCHRSPDEPA